MESWFEDNQNQIRFHKIDKELLLLLEKNIRGGISSVLGPRYIESDENTKH